MLHYQIFTHHWQIGLYIIVASPKEQKQEGEGEEELMDEETVEEPIRKEREQCSFDEACKSLIERCMFLLLGVSSALPGETVPPSPGRERKQMDVPGKTWLQLWWGL